MILLGILVFIFGLIIGSFLNVVALRYNTGRTIGGRSFCFSCSKTLRWYELVPVFSFISQGGRCRHCHSKISWQYPLVELSTALLFLFTFLKFGDVTVDCVYYFVIWSLLTVIVIYDLRHKIIPDGMVYTFAILAAVHLLFNSPSGANLLSGALLFLPFYLLWYLSDGKWIGLGDGKLALGIGYSLGLVDGLSAIVLGFWLGAVAALIILGPMKWLSPRSRRLTMKSEMPFAPFLILGMILIFFFRWDILGLHAVLSLWQ